MSRRSKTLEAQLDLVPIIEPGLCITEKKAAASETLLLWYCHGEVARVQITRLLVGLGT